MNTFAIEYSSLVIICMFSIALVTVVLTNMCKGKELKLKIEFEHRARFFNCKNALNDAIFFLSFCYGSLLSHTAHCRASGPFLHAFGIPRLLLDGTDKFTAHFCQTQAAFLDARGPKKASEGVRSASEYGTLLVFRQFVNYLASLLSLAVRIKG